MTLDKFCYLDSRGQLAIVLLRGTYLARRWEEEGAVSLYHVADQGRGFFVEIGYDACTHGAIVLGSFSSSVPLEAYLYWVQLRES